MSTSFVSSNRWRAEGQTPGNFKEVLMKNVETAELEVINSDSKQEDAANAAITRFWNRVNQVVDHALAQGYLS